MILCIRRTIMSFLSADKFKISDDEMDEDFEHSNVQIKLPDHDPVVCFTCR